MLQRPTEFWGPRPYPIRIFTIIVLLPLIFLSCTSSKRINNPDFLEKIVLRVLNGEESRIRVNDYPIIHQLLDDGRPEYRRAGIILAGQSEAPEFHQKILESMLDNDKAVSHTALTIISKEQELYRSLILKILGKEEPSQRVEALKMLVLFGGENFLPLFIRYFTDPNPIVRNQASLAVRTVSNSQNPLLRASLTDDNPLQVLMGIKTLGYFAQQEDIPIFIAAFSNPDGRIRQEAQLAVLRLGEKGLPSLHAEASNPDQTLPSRLSALDIIQGLRSPKSLSLLLTLLSDDTEKISSKADFILNIYGSESIPTLISLYPEFEEEQREKILLLMGKIQESTALPTVLRASKDPSLFIRNAAKISLENFGESAYPILREEILVNTYQSEESAMTVLRQGGDPWLFQKDEGSINHEALLLLVIHSSLQEIQTYQEIAQIPFTEREAMISLKKIWDMGAEFTAWNKDIAEGKDPYLEAWRQRERNKIDSRRFLRESFDYLHRYFKSQNSDDLKTSKDLRRQSRQREEKAQEQEILIATMDKEESLTLENRWTRYKEMRQTLIHTWEYLDPAFQVLALSFYTKRGIDLPTLTEQSIRLD